MKLYENGAYLVNGRDVVINSPEAASAVNAKTGKTVTPEDAKKQTIAYGILKNHNTSGNMEKLQIKFDKLTSHDITFVGIIQTARASGLEKFPIPYVLTNCQNGLCAVGGTINEDVWTDMCKEIRRNLCSSSSGSYSPVCKRNACRRRKDDPWIRLPYPLRSTGNHGNWRRWSGACKAAFE